MLHLTAKAVFHAGRLLLWLVLSLFAIALLVAALLASLDVEHYRKALTDQVEQATGRELVIDGEMGFKFSVVPTFYAEKVRFANASWGRRPWMFTAGRVEASIDLVSLVKRELRLGGIKVMEPVVWIEKQPGGRVNWDLRGSEPRPKASLGWLFIDRLDGFDGRVEYSSWGREQSISFDILKVRVDEETQWGRVRLRGTLEGRSLRVWGVLNSFETLVNRWPSSMNLKIRYGESEAEARGRVRDLLSWEGADVDLKAEIDRLSDLSPVLPFRLPAIGPVRGTARLVQPGAWRSMEIRDISLVSRQPGLDARLSGRWGGPDQPERTDLRLLAEGKLSSVLSSVDVESSAPLQVSVDARLLGSGDGYRVSLPELEVKGEGVSLRSTVGVEGVRAGSGGRIPVAAEIATLEKFGALFGVELPPWGPVTGSAVIANGEQGIALGQIDLEMKSEVLQARATGEVADLAGLSGGLLSLSGTAPDLKPFEALEVVKIALPPLKKLKIEGEITLEEGRLRGKVERLVGGERGVEVTVDGKVGDLRRFGDIGLHVAGKAKRLPDLDRLFDISLPAFGPLEVEGDLLREGTGPIDFVNVKAVLADKEVDMSLGGAFLDLGPKMRTRLEAKMTAGSMESFNSLAGFDLPREGPVKATGVVASEGPGKWYLEDLNAVLDHPELKLTARGRVDSLFRAWLPDLSVQVSRLSTVRLASLWKMRIPLGGTLSASARARRRAGKPLALEKISGALHGEGLDLTFSGRIQSVSPLAGIDLAVAVKADNTRRIGWLEDAGLQKVGPVSADFSVTSDEHGKEYRFEVRRAEIRNSDARGNLVWRLPLDTGVGRNRPRPRLDMWMSSEVLDLKMLMPKPPGRKGGLFDPTPFKTEWMRKLDGSWEVRVNNYRDQVADVSDLHAKMNLRDGRFEIPEMAARLGKGEVRLSLSLDATRKPHPIRLELRARKADPARFSKARESELFISGEMDIDMDIRGAGNSVAELMGSADGRFLAVFRDSRIRVANLDLFAGDIFTNLITVVNPLVSRSDIANVECAVLNLPIHKGMVKAKRILAMKTDRITLLGGGVINLRDESLNLVISPKAREGFGISPGTLAKMVGVAGTITEPRVDTHFRGYLETGAVIGAAIATSGLTLLAQGLWDRLTANADVCQVVLERGPKPRISERKIGKSDLEKR